MDQQVQDSTSSKKFVPFTYQSIYERAKLSSRCQIRDFAASYSFLMSRIAYPHKRIEYLLTMSISQSLSTYLSLNHYSLSTATLPDRTLFSVLHPQQTIHFVDPHQLASHKMPHTANHN